MRTNDLGKALALLAGLGCGGCAELAAATPSVTIGAAATERATSSGSGWSWAVWGGLGSALDGAALVPPAEHEEGARGPAPALLAPLACRVPALCAWEARARSRALERARARVAP